MTIQMGLGVGGEGRVTRKKRIFCENVGVMIIQIVSVGLYYIFFDVKSTMSQPLALRIRWQQGEIKVNKKPTIALNQFCYQYLIDQGIKKYKTRNVQISFILEGKDLLIDSEQIVSNIKKELLENVENTKKLSIIGHVVDKGQKYEGRVLKSEKIDARQKKEGAEKVEQKKVQQNHQKRSGKEPEKQERKVESRQNKELPEKKKESMKEDVKDKKNPKKEDKVEKGLQKKQKEEQKSRKIEKNQIKPEAEAKDQQKYGGGGLKSEKFDGKQKKKESGEIVQKKAEQNHQKKQGKEPKKQNEKVESPQKQSKLPEKKEQQVKDVKDKKNPKKEDKIEEGFLQKQREEQKSNKLEKDKKKPEAEAKEQQKQAQMKSIIQSGMDKSMQQQVQKSINNSVIVLSDTLQNESSIEMHTRSIMSYLDRTQATQLAISIVEELSSIQNQSNSEKSDFSKFYSLLGNIGESMSYTLGTKCCLCHQVLSNMPVYRCYYCPNSYFCRKCQILKPDKNHSCYDHIMIKITSLNQFEIINPDAKVISKKVLSKQDGNNNISEMQYQEKLPDKNKQSSFIEDQEDINGQGLNGDDLRLFLIDDAREQVKQQDFDQQERKREEDKKKRKQNLQRKKQQQKADKNAKNDSSEKNSDNEAKDKKNQNVLKEKPEKQQKKKVEEINPPSSPQKGQKQEEIKPAKKIEETPAKQQKPVSKLKKAKKRTPLTETALALKQTRMKQLYKDMPKEQFDSYFTGKYEYMSFPEVQIQLKKKEEQKKKEEEKEQNDA